MDALFNILSSKSQDAQRALPDDLRQMTAPATRETMKYFLSGFYDDSPAADAVRAIVKEDCRPEELSKAIRTTGSDAISGDFSGLMLAAARNHVAAIDLYADQPLVDLNVRGKWDWTPLHCAAFFNAYDAIDRLLTRKADASLCTFDGLTAYDLADAKGRAVFEKNRAFKQYLAAQKKPVKTIAAPVQADPRDSTPTEDRSIADITEMARHNFDKHISDVRARLFSQYARSMKDLAQKSGRVSLLSALIDAAQRNDTDTVRKLISAGADVNAPKPDMHIAAGQDKITYTKKDAPGGGTLTEVFDLKAQQRLSYVTIDGTVGQMTVTPFAELGDSLIAKARLDYKERAIARDIRPIRLPSLKF